jgi:hypothetical protein
MGHSNRKVEDFGKLERERVAHQSYRACYEAPADLSIISSCSITHACVVESPGKTSSFQPFSNHPWKWGRAHPYAASGRAWYTVHEASDETAEMLLYLVSVIRIA